MDYNKCGTILTEQRWLDPEHTRNPARWNYTSECGSSNRARHLFTRVRAVAIKAWDRSGVDLLEQIIHHMKSSPPSTQAVVGARRTLHQLTLGDYPHFRKFVAEFDSLIDEMAREVRHGIVAGLLDGSLQGEGAAEAIAQLKPVPITRYWNAIAFLEDGVKQLDRGVA